MPQSRMEEHKSVKVRVVRGEVLRGVQGVEVLYIRADLHRPAESVFDDCAKGVGGRAGGEGELGVAIRHCFGADEDHVEGGAGEEVGELEPDFSRETGFGARA